MPNLLMCKLSSATHAVSAYMLNN